MKELNLGLILPLVALILGITAIVVLPSIRTAINKISASYSAQLSFAPSTVVLNDSQVVPVDLMLNPNGAKLGFARVVIYFNPDLFKLNSEIDVSPSPLGQIIKVSSMVQANAEGKVEIVLGLRPVDRNSPMTTAAKIAILNLKASTTTANQGNLSFLNSDIQIVDMDGTIVQPDSAQAQIVINPTLPTPNPSPSLIPTPTVIATPKPSISPTPSASPSPSISPKPLPTATVSPVPTATPQASLSPSASPTQANGLLGSYFKSKDLTRFAIQRVDSNINFNWRFGRPTTSVGRDNFSVRWEGKVKTTDGGNYTFFTRSDDGVRLKVNNVLLINDWRNHGLQERSGSINLPANSQVDITLEYFENVGVAEIYLLWQTPNGSKVIIPNSSLLIK